MGLMTRTLIVLCSALIVVQSLMLCAATGWRSFTRFPDAELAKMHEQQGSLTSLFEGTGDDQGPRLIANTFTFGLLPSPTLSPEAISVASVGGPALLAGLLALVTRSPRGRPARSTS